jgi:aminoglycoside/choline kinase family phosphotransferase
MDHPTDTGSTEPFVTLSDYFLQRQLPVPKVIAQSRDSGFVLLQDFGDELYANCLAKDNATPLYRKALEALVRLHACPPKPLGPFKALDKDLIELEITGFREWFLEKHLGFSLTAKDILMLQDTAIWLSKEILQQPQVFMHRDYHSRNLILRPGNQLGIIDFQDAMLGPITYDVVSLLRDCYIDWPNKLVEELALYYKAAAEEQKLMQPVSNETFLRWLDVTGVERHLKALFTFSRKAVRDEDKSYLENVSRTLGYLKDIMPAYPELAPLANWLIEKEVM